MIKKETFWYEGREYVWTYSNAEKFIIKDGNEYVEAVAPVECWDEEVYTEGRDIPQDFLAQYMNMSFDPQ